ncbi:MAG TPA: DUF1311 domain-containing protein [Balneola sp.]|nr:hypothetical protein [Bacteroidota bacterium]HCI69335.1 DUF1311 domain-containing protein [Balneola sp.]HCT55053.1 DUF1311 domain-containing protein [Balneola sp.]|tara:strand:+ start:1026 stop:1442 length:417 start_codon:yes stop_codon:yes gene_type:complete
MTTKIAVLFSFLILLPCSKIIAQTQLEMNAAALEEFQQSEQKMDSVFTTILEKYHDQSEFLSQLKKAQEVWLKFRDAHVESLFPEPDKRFYGSAYSFCASSALLELNKQRIEQLMVWLKGSEEGDICSGSIKMDLELH